ncbi:MAG: hypothetical protein A2X49_16640 [Lentisphaerae bacterium GWF2_52_8]|nr:MAG: hypothetical protein A2X49_16640 [Lentisphaerae bacterium GWF2_52_8]
MAIPDSFLNLPFDLYKGVGNWTPRPADDTVRLLDPARNPYWRQAERELFVAFKDGKPVGRIVAVDDREFNTTHNTNLGFFGFFECVEDLAVARTLFSSATNWLSQKGRTQMRGPFNPIPDVNIGLMVEGFEIPQSFCEPFNPPFYVELFEACSFRKLSDFYSYHNSFSNNPVWEKMMARLRRHFRKSTMRIRHFELEHFDRDVEIIRSIINDTYSHDSFFAAWSFEMQHFVIETYLRPGNEQLFLFVEVEGAPAGFCLLTPDYDEALRADRDSKPEAIKGSCAFEFCISPRFIQTPATAMLTYASWDAQAKAGFHWSEISFMNENNKPIHSLLETSGATRTKCFRLYECECKLLL